MNTFYPDECRVVMSAMIREKGFERRSSLSHAPALGRPFASNPLRPVAVARSWIEDAKMAKALNLHDKLVRTALSVMTADLLLQRCAPIALTAGLDARVRVRACACVRWCASACVRARVRACV